MRLMQCRVPHQLPRQTLPQRTQDKARTQEVDGSIELERQESCGAIEVIS